MTFVSDDNKSSYDNAIAIIGISCIFPGAPSVVRFWDNIVKGVDSIRDAGPGEWDADFYKNKSSSTFGKIYCTRGGFITEFAEFDPLEFGIMPTSVHGADPDQFLVLRTAAEALTDAGYHHKTFDGERAEIIIGRTMATGMGAMNLIQHGQTVDQVLQIVQAVCPQMGADQLAEVGQRLRGELRPCNADTIPAVMPNVMSGRIANKLGFRGRNLILDAACASSLLALETAMMGLQCRQSDLAIAGGVHVNSSAGFYQMFCGLGALSQSGKIRPFDDNADGTVLGEGVGMVVLKRLDDAIRDGNRIYAAIRGIGSSSDGRSGGLLAPNVDGEVLAMRRAYEKAGVSPKTIGLLEAHGTGTKAGDWAEINAVKRVFCEPVGEEPEVTKPWCALGSVKSMIGHTQAASGMAGLIKATLALHHKILPPTLNVLKPNSQVDWSQSPCFINSKARPWVTDRHQEPVQPRRAAVSSFGFGGINAHVILEEHIPCAAEQVRQTEQFKPANADKVRPGSIKLALNFPALSARSLDGMQLPGAMDVQPQASAAPDVTETAESTAVLKTFQQTMALVHQNMLGVQENVMLAYLNDDDDPAK